MPCFRYINTYQGGYYYQATIGYESKVILQLPLIAILMCPDSPQPEPQELRMIQYSVEPETPHPTTVTAWLY